MRAMTIHEIDEVSAGITNAEAGGIGLGMIGIGIGIAAGPVGWFGIGVAALLSYGGGAVIGTAIAREAF